MVGRRLFHFGAKGLFSAAFWLVLGRVVVVEIPVALVKKKKPAVTFGSSDDSMVGMLVPLKKWDQWHSPSPNWQEIHTTYIPWVVPPPSNSGK